MKARKDEKIPLMDIGPEEFLDFLAPKVISGVLRALAESALRFELLIILNERVREGFKEANIRIESVGGVI